MNIKHVLEKIKTIVNERKDLSLNEMGAQIVEVALVDKKAYKQVYETSRDYVRIVDLAAELETLSPDSQEAEECISEINTLLVQIEKNLKKS